MVCVACPALRAACMFACRLLAGCTLKRSKDNLRPSRFARIEVLVCVRRFIQRQFMRDDHRRLRLAGLDQLAQVTIVGLDVRLPGAHAQSLAPEFAEVEGDLTLARKLIAGLRILRHEDTHYPERACR